MALTQEELREFCAWLQAHAEIFEEDAEGLYPFLEAVTASEDYGNFLRVMFAEVQRQQLQQLDPAEAAGPQMQEIAVTVPEGVSAGEAFAVEYLGARYELAVPEGYGPGMSFSATVTLPTAQGN
mmetsp:Transcript_29689/g.78640  ORF Transcript_29689/g.78640 Transcript_29689/m.78640 type:complete len:124 (+) Transcript_29689:1-372(+)